MASEAPWSLEAHYDDLFARAKQAAFRILLDQHDAEDAAGEALVRAAAHAGELAAHPSPAAWVARVAVNVAIDLRRRRTSPVLPMLPSAFESDVIRRVDIADALRRLPARQREAVVLRHLAGFPEAESAAALGVSVATLKTHVKRAFATLRTRLGPAIEDAFTGPPPGEWVREMDGPLGPGLELPEPRNRPMDGIEPRWLEPYGYVRGYMRSWFHLAPSVTGVGIWAFEFSHEHGARRWHRDSERGFDAIDFTERFDVPTVTGTHAMVWKSEHTCDSWLTLAAFTRTRFTVNVQAETLVRDDVIRLTREVVSAQNDWLGTVLSGG